MPGPKGALIAFRDEKFANPAALVGWITGQGTLAKLRPDMKLVVMRSWDSPEERLKGDAPAHGATRQARRLTIELAEKPPQRRKMSNEQHIRDDGQNHARTQRAQGSCESPSRPQLATPSLTNGKCSDILSGCGSLLEANA